MSEQKLPMAEPAPGAAAATPPIEIEVSSFRLVITLTIAGALAGLAIVLVFTWAQPRIEAYQARVLAAAVTEVLAGAERYRTVFLDEDGVFKAQPAADTAGLEERIYVGYDADDNPVGVAVAGGKAGFQDIIRVIFGYDPATGDVLGMRVLDHKETPGLGDKIVKDSTFVDQFVRVATLIQAVKKGRESGADEEIVMITGATISSQAVIDVINMRVDELRDPINAYWSSADVMIPPSEAADSVTPTVGGGGGP